MNFSFPPGERYVKWGLRQLESFSPRLRALFGKRGFISGILKHMPAYLQPGFHPSQQQTQALACA